MPLNFGIGNGLDLILYIIAAALVLVSQSRIQNAYAKYSQVISVNGLSGAEVAKRMLLENNITNVKVQQASGGTLSDHYDPRDLSVNLSESVYRDASIASIAVAAHEVGHAIQHHVGYRYLMVRHAIAPIASLASGLSFPILMLGLFTNINAFFTIGIVLFFAAALFQIVTLPVEFNASSRALKLLESEKILVPAEIGDAQKMLRAAAFTYVAGLGNTIIQIIRILGYRNRN